MRNKVIEVVASLCCAGSAVAQLHLSNLSTRGFVGTGDQVLIAGLIITGGSSSKPMLFRALGPSLAELNVTNTLEDPVLEVHDANGTLIDFNDDWQDDFYWNTVQQLGYAPHNQFESAMYSAASQRSETSPRHSSCRAERNDGNQLSKGILSC